MGLMGDIRSGKKSEFGLGAYAIIFWLMVGCGAGGALGYATVGLDKAVQLSGFLGGVIGVCVGLYAAFGDTRLAKALALPGYVLAIFGF